MNKCVICNEEIKTDSQYIEGRWYHNKCIINRDSVKIVDISYYNSKVSGCDTCDYGASYINNIIITWDDNVKVEFHAYTDYDVMSESDWMILLANTNNRDEIISKWKEKYRDYLDDTDNVFIKVGEV